jgi:hypothetical protein
MFFPATINILFCIIVISVGVILRITEKKTNKLYKKKWEYWRKK